MVLAAITILVILVTQVSYVASVNRKMADNGQDQLKALYLAKSGLKLSLLRLKAYQHVKGVIQTMSGNSAAAALVPKGIIEKIWSFPFIFPIPADIPGLSLQAKDQILKFQKDSGLDGSFTSIIESESSKFPINSVLPSFAKAAENIAPSPSPSPSPGGTARPSPTPTPDPNGSPDANAGGFDAEAARKSLETFLTRIIQNKFEADPDFAEEYRDFSVEEFMDYLLTWMDRTYEARGGGREVIPPKRAPLYSISELRMIHGIDDRLYELVAPSLTTSRTSGSNVNTMTETTFRAIVPNMTDEEVTDRKIKLITDEQSFKITVRAQVNQSIRVIEAYVTLTSKTGGTRGTRGTRGNTADQPPEGAPPQDPNAPPASASKPDAGLKVTFMRIL